MEADRDADRGRIGLIDSLLYGTSAHQHMQAISAKNVVRQERLRKNLINTVKEN